MRVEPSLLLRSIQVVIAALVGLLVPIVYAQTSTTVVTDAIGEKWLYEFEENLGIRNLVRKQALSDKKQVTQEYDQDNNLIRKVDTEGHVTTHTYNQYNQRVSTTVAVGTPQERTATYEYMSPELNLLASIEEESVFGGLKKKTLRQYDEQLNLATETTSGFDVYGNPISRRMLYRYNNYGQITQIDGPRIDVDDSTVFEYYDCSSGFECGQLASTTNAMGHQTTFDAYDANGRLLRKTDANGLIITYDYHPRGWLVKVTETAPTGTARVTSYEYDSVGQTTKVTTPVGAELTYHYNAAHELRSVTDNVGNVVEYSYDPKGNRISEEIRDPRGTLVRRVERTYDIRNQVVAINRGRGNGQPGSVSETAKDTVGNLILERDPNGYETTYEYDGLNRLVQKTSPLFNMTFYDYDSQNNIVRVTAPNGAETSYEYDDLGNQRKELSPDRGMTTRSFDEAGNMRSETDARGVEVLYTYDALNRVTQVDYPGPEEDVEFQYDTATSPDSCSFGVGRLCVRTDSSGVTRYTYDVFGNLVGVERDILGHTYTTAYGYDSEDRVVSMTYPSGRVVDITRDALGRLSALSTTVDGEVTDVISDRSYLGDGLVDYQTYGNDLAETRTFDLQGRIRVQRVSTEIYRDYSYDANGNILSVVDGDGARTYTYDVLDRVLGASFGSETLGYVYDANGNRLSLEKDMESLEYTYEPRSNRLRSIVDASIEYSSAGQIVADRSGERNFEYNAAGRLEKVMENGAEKARYVYDSMGLRVVRITSAGSTVYHYNPEGLLIAESGEDGTVQREYLYADSEPVAMINVAVSHTDPAELTAPDPARILDTSPVKIEWVVDDASVERVILRVGSVQGAQNIFNSDVSGKNSQYVYVPLRGNDVYLSLYSLIGDEWKVREYVFRTSNQVMENVAAILAALKNGDKLKDIPLSLNWSIDTFVNRFLRRIGFVSHIGKMRDIYVGGYVTYGLTPRMSGITRPWTTPRLASSWIGRWERSHGLPTRR